MPETNPDQTIAERHHLESGDLCEISIIDFTGTSRRYAIYRYTEARPHGVEPEVLHFMRAGWSMSVRASRVRSIRKVTPEYVCSQHYRGEIVRIRKYGSEYHAEVRAVKRTRLTVAFTTRGGKEKVFDIPATEVL